MYYSDVICLQIFTLVISPKEYLERLTLILHIDVQLFAQCDISVVMSCDKDFDFHTFIAEIQMKDDLESAQELCKAGTNSKVRLSQYGVTLLNDPLPNYKNDHLPNKVTNLHITN